MPPSLHTGDPSEVGLDPARLARIRPFFEEKYVKTGKLPGVLTLIARRGRVVHCEWSGQRDVEAGTPLQYDTIFRIYSMTKPIVSVALMTLYEEGRFHLDDPVSRFLPAWRDLRVFVDGTPEKYTTTFPTREMTVRDLLTHTAGLTYGFMGRHPLDALYRRNKIDRVQAIDGGGTLSDMIEGLSRLPLLFSPGTRWSYSVATDVVGHLVEVLSGQRLDAYLQARIFTPLQMPDTGFSVPDASAHRLAACYTCLPGDPLRLVDAPATSTYRKPPSFLSGGGGLVSTAADYLRFTQMLLNGGELDGARVLGRKTVAFMGSNHLPTGGDLASMGQPVFSETSYEGIGFGLGFSVVLDPARAQMLCSAGEMAWGGAASTAFWIDPEEELAAILLTQLLPSSSYPIRREFRTLTYQALVS